MQSVERSYHTRTLEYSPSLDHDHLLPLGSSLDPGVRIYSLKFLLLLIPYRKLAFLVDKSRLKLSGAAFVAATAEEKVMATVIERMFNYVE
jgi:hypothetical protein